MAQFSANPTRLDPYKNFKFRLKWDGKYIFGGSKLTGLKRTTEVVEHRSPAGAVVGIRHPGVFLPNGCGVAIVAVLGGG